MTNADPKKPTHNEEIKAASPTLAGAIAATLADPAVDHFSEDDNQFLKFHGSYQQDDRDLRKTGKKYIMMIRGRIPGGVMTAKQYGVFDTLASKYGNNTLRITTRQSIQFHGVIKSNLRPLVQAINESLLSTLAACGDVTRNVLAPPTPAYTKAREQVFADCHKVAMALAPQTKAYHSIWIDGVPLDLEKAENKDFADPLYGKTYLPRKFKIAFVIPPVKDAAGNVLNPFGNASRNPGRTPPFNETDLDLNKKFDTPIESLKLEFRAEAYNVFNHQVMGGPDTNPTDPNFGRVFGDGWPNSSGRWLSIQGRLRF